MSRRGLIEEPATHAVIGAFFEVHNTLGFGFAEHLYVSALERELRANGHEVSREVSVPVFYKGELLGTHRIDVIVDGRVVVEAKATAQLAAFAERQLLNYLTATSLEVGLLLHFGPTAKFYRLVATKNKMKKP
jgi:GxxExxY protein